MDRNRWQEELTSAETRLGFTEGFKFVYGPWATLDVARVAFLSLNPGKAPEGENPRTVSDERGNSYEVNRDVTRSRITPQFLKLAELLEVAPCDILTGVAAPFRSRNWESLTQDQREGALAIGRRFWGEPLRNPNVRLIIASSKGAGRLACELTNASLADEVTAGWGNIKLRRYGAGGDKTVVQLPQLSRFQLLSRPESEQAIRRVLGLSAAHVPSCGKDEQLGARDDFGFRPFPKRGVVVTNELIDRLRAEGKFDRAHSEGGRAVRA